MAETIQDIQARISAFENDVNYLAMRERWEADYDSYTLEPYKAAKGFYAYTSNSPRVYIDKLLSIISKSKLTVRIPLETLTEPEREVANNTERYLYGCFNLNDERLSRIPDTPSLRQTRAFYALLRGGFARYAYVYKDEQGNTVPYLCSWDIYNTRYGRGSRGATWAANITRVTKEQVKSQWDKEITAAEADQIDYWSDEVNCVYIGSDWMKNPTPHNLGYNPVTIHRTGAQPLLREITDLRVNANQGESALKANRDINPIVNQVISDLVTIVHRGVKAPMKEITHTGESKINGDPFGDKTAVMTYKVGEGIEPMAVPSMPQDAAQLLGIISGETQRGALPFTAYGELGFRLSGFAINQLQSSMETVIEPFITCLEQAYKMDCMQLVDQYAEEAWTPVKVRGRTSRNNTFGFPSGEMIDPATLKKGWYPEVAFVPVLPKDDAQKLQMAAVARTPDARGIPMLSDRTIMDEIIGVEDPDLEQGKREQEWGDTMPINRLYTAYIKAAGDGDAVRAQNILMELQRLMASQGQPMGQPAKPGLSGQSSPSEQMSLENPGMGLPVPETGMTPQTLPAEMSGGAPPGAAGGY